MVVVLIVGLTGALATLALRDGETRRLEEEGARLAALLDSARLESRAAGVAITWRPSGAPGPAPNAGSAPSDFRFEWDRSAGTLPFPSRWLYPETQAEVEGASRVILGPEPILPAQRIRLRTKDRSLVVGSNGLDPFTVQSAAP